MESFEQFVRVRVVNGTTSFYITSIYGCPISLKHCVLLRRMTDLKEEIHGAWCIGGDYNCVLYDHEMRFIA